MEEITIVEIPTQKVIGIRKQGKYELIAQLIPQVYEYAMSKNVEFAGPPLFICHEISLEEVLKADQEGAADIEIAVPIAEAIEESDEVKCYDLPGGTMAKIIHKGPYHECQSTYEKLYAWINQNGKQIVGALREAYLNDPREITPEEILTEIYAPIG